MVLPRLPDNNSFDDSDSFGNNGAIGEVKAAGTI
jgi:hypothetical protein